MKILLTYLIVLIAAAGCNSYSYQEEQLTEEEEIILYTDSNIYIHGIHLKIKGEINGSATIRSGGDIMFYIEHAFLKEGEIDIDFSGDHYNDTCYILYQPKSATKAIEYEFYGDDIY